MTTREVFEKIPREEGIAFFNDKKTDKEIYDLLVSRGLTDSFDTFISEAKKVFEEKVSTMSKEEIMAQIEGAELTDEQLEMIAGGKDDEEQQEITDATIIAGGVVMAAWTGYLIATSTAGFFGAMM